MRELIYTLLQSQGELSPRDILLRIGIAAVIGIVIFVSYIISHNGTIYSKKFNVTLVVLTVLTATVMTVIGNNIALSLGMVGALSIVRFRTAIKDSRDTAYIFWTIIVGICCGAGDYLVAAIGSVVVFFILLMLGSIKSDNRMILIVRGARAVDSKIESTVYQLFKGRAIMRAKNTTDISTEYIYEFSSKEWSKANKDKNVTDTIYSIDQIEYVSVVIQNDEISN